MNLDSKFKNALERVDNAVEGFNECARAARDERGTPEHSSYMASCAMWLNHGKGWLRIAEQTLDKIQKTGGRK